MSVGESLERWRRLAGVGAPSTMATISAAWSELLGTLAHDIEPRALVDGTLLVVASEPASAEAMRWRAETLRGALCERLGDGVVLRVEVRLESRRGRL
jgi:hypothetical protein